MEDEFVKVTNIVYKMLEFFPESDPLKNKTKERVLSIMENLILLKKRKASKENWVSLGDCLKGVPEKSPSNLLEEIDILLSFLRLGKLQGWISDANFLIICNEYEKIKKEIEYDFPISYNKQPLLEIFKEINIRTNIKEKEEPKLSPFINSNEKKDEKINNVKNFLSERQAKIIKFLKENKRAQVMDLKKILNNVTKRTIRRDLDDLLRKGSVTRVGEWNQVFYQISEDK